MEREKPISHSKISATSSSTSATKYARILPSTSAIATASIPSPMEKSISNTTPITWENVDWLSPGRWRWLRMCAWLCYSWGKRGWSIAIWRKWISWLIDTIVEGWSISARSPTSQAAVISRQRMRRCDQLSDTTFLTGMQWLRFLPLSCSWAGTSTTRMRHSTCMA